jgi:predicted AlkP superfamily pyrophosphatase or phosphodiesterase
MIGWMRTACWFLLSAAAWGADVRVLVVGVDGLGAFALRDSPPPNIAALMKRGIWTLKARGVLPTVSSPNWASMIMGAGPERHGVTSNEWEIGKFSITPECSGPDGRFPTIFGWLHSRTPEVESVVVHDWNGFGRLVEPGAAVEVRHVLGSPKTADAAIEVWRGRKPGLLFVHFDDVDHAGHDHGFGSAEYRAAVEMIDGLLGRLVEAVGPETFVLFTADHGGTGTKHGQETMRDLEIPWILAGPGVPANNEIKTPVNTVDTASTVAALFGVEPHPCWVGRSQAPKVSRK